MAQGTYIQEGERVDYTPSAAVDSGDVIVQSSLVGIATEPIAADTLGALTVRGIFDVVQAAEIIVAGDLVYWDADGDPVGGTAGTGAATATSTGNTFMGFAQALTAATDTVVRVSLASAGSGVLVSSNVTGAIGVTTAAAGTTTGDAGALPAGATIVPTTAADDTKGVLINATDKVDGRMLFIGNGVVNKILKVYPATGGTINGAAANAAFSSVSGKGVIAVCLSASANTWLAW